MKFTSLKYYFTEFTFQKNVDFVGTVEGVVVITVAVVGVITVVDRLDNWMEQYENAEQRIF